MNIDNFLETLLNFRLLKEKEISWISQQIIQILVEEPNVIRVQAPIVVCGNLNGKYRDLLEIFQVVGQLPQTNYLFLGGYAVKGCENVETLCYLFCLKIKYPEKIILLRGNQESKIFAKFFGLYEEITKKYQCKNVWKYLSSVLEYLPLAAVIEEKIFCVHGGLSPNIQTIDDISTLDRRVEIPEQGPLTDLMWSDPDDVDEWKPSPRGAGHLFGQKMVEAFNYTNQLDLIIRSNQLVIEGYEYLFNKKLLTIWSCTNHCYRMGNPGVAVEIDYNMSLKIQQFMESKQYADFYIEQIFPKIF